jgi:hypothetical protein
MTEAEWLACSDAHEMFMEVMRDASPRKIRLLGCACVSWMWTWGLDEVAPEAVQVAEAFADGLASKKDLKRVANEINTLRAQCEEPYRPFPRTCELTELLASPSRFHEVLEELQGFAADMSITQEPGWHRIAGFVRDIFDNPFRPVRFGPGSISRTIKALAQAAYEERAQPSGELDLARLKVLADALEEAGCTEQTILDHLRGPGPHVRGCWPVDLILRRE